MKSFSRGWWEQRVLDISWAISIFTPRSLFHSLLRPRQCLPLPSRNGSHKQLLRWMAIVWSFPDNYDKSVGAPVRWVRVRTYTKVLTYLTADPQVYKVRAHFPPLLRGAHHSWRLHPGTRTVEIYSMAITTDVCVQFPWKRISRFSWGLSSGRPQPPAPRERVLRLGHWGLMISELSPEVTVARAFFFKSLGMRRDRAGDGSRNGGDGR